MVASYTVAHPPPYPGTWCMYCTRTPAKPNRKGCTFEILVGPYLFTITNPLSISDESSWILVIRESEGGYAPAQNIVYASTRPLVPLRRT